MQKMPNFWPSIEDPYPNFVVPQTIPGVHWSYSENLETIALPVPELLAKKKRYTNKAPYT